MKKLLIVLSALTAFLTLSACSSGKSSATSASSGTRNFQTANGTVKIPSAPKRVVVQNYPDEALALGVTVVGTDSWAYPNPYFSAAQKKNLVDLGAPSFNLPKLIAQKPDLIVATDKTQVANYEKVAPTVLVDYSKFKNMKQSLDYFADLLNRKDAEKAFLDSFNKTAADEQKKLAAAGIAPADKTVSILELQGDKIYAYGDNFARGGQALTYGLGFKESAQMKKLSAGAGYAQVNAESLKDFDADYIFVDFASADSAQFAALSENPAFKALKGKIITMDYSKVYFFGGPIASQKEMPIYTDAILAAK
ncbi:MAG: ABC transporter substrate-binding protein [Streptococcaceae bacterium]|nr:ABC transporter substrate-binding protein [Streptococcaceae bacterium]